ncbi:MAG: hypothetical protein M1453_05070 [Acidobacteria bacterium]|nr:hypothetical protein [Acidobacteriota bacterium]
MPKTVTPFEVHAWLDENFRARAEFGFRKALTRCVLEPPNPFDPQARRKPRAGFVILVLLAAATITCFLYFNVVT